LSLRWAEPAPAPSTEQPDPRAATQEPTRHRLLAPAAATAPRPLPVPFGSALSGPLAASAEADLARRLTDEVIRQVERRLRIERERRGL
jgi:hypothetical protein